MDFFGEEEIKHKKEEFKRHLDNADRMIFSAKFGDGKTFFLQKIREDKQLFSDYEFITLYPVNYVVAHNEDIFEYIKRDILVQLANLDLLNNIDLTKLVTSFASFENLKEVLYFLLSCIPGYGVFIQKILDKGLEVAEKYNAEKATFEKYFDNFKSQRGGLYEDDAYTIMIKEALSLLRNGYIGESGEIKKKPVLIIEDLDRLDPAHIFRILNVISAHIDDTTKPDKIGNKFGFSNIVIVMDYDTTKNIFEHFYGRDASYTGYMSKFISEEPFRYSITSLALPKLKDKIAREIGITKEFIENMEIFNKKLAELSIRDVVRLYDFNVKTRLYQSYMVFPQEIFFSSNLPLFKLIVYMTELGMSFGDIDVDLDCKERYNESEYLKIMYPFYFISKKRPKQYFACKDGNKMVELIKDKQIVVDIRIVDYDGIISSGMCGTIGGRNAWRCEILDNCIDIAGFNRSRGNTVTLSR